jgi:hypothetical protein
MPTRNRTGPCPTSGQRTHPSRSQRSPVWTTRTGTYSQLFADARGVFRVYQMTFDDRVWRIWREAPVFHQRFEDVRVMNAEMISLGTDARWESAVGGDEQDRDVVAQVTPVGGCFE